MPSANEKNNDDSCSQNAKTPEEQIARIRQHASRIRHTAVERQQADQDYCDNGMHPQESSKRKEWAFANWRSVIMKLIERDAQQCSSA